MSNVTTHFNSLGCESCGARSTFATWVYHSKQSHNQVTGFHSSQGRELPLKCTTWHRRCNQSDTSDEWCSPEILFQCQKSKQHTTMTQTQVTTGVSIIHSFVNSVYTGNKLCLVGCNWPNTSLTFRNQHRSTPCRQCTRVQCICNMKNLCELVFIRCDWGLFCASLCFSLRGSSSSLSLSLSPSLSLLILTQINRVSLRHRPLY